LTSLTFISRQGRIRDFVKGGARYQFHRGVRKKFFAFIFQLSGWAVVAPSWFASQVPDVRGSMLHTHAAQRDVVDTCLVRAGRRSQSQPSVLGWGLGTRLNLSISHCVKRQERVMKKGGRKGIVVHSYRPSNSAILGDCAALLLRHRNHNLNAVQRIISIILYGGHAAKQVLLCNCLQNTFVVYRLLLRQVC